MESKEEKYIKRGSSDDLRGRSVRSGMVNIGSQVASLLITILSTVVLARLIEPSSYGLMGMVATITSFATLFKDLGLSTAVVQRDELTEDQLSVMFWINALLGLVLSSVVALISPLVANFYDKPELVWVTVALGFNIFIASLGTQHSALLTRFMRFGAIAVARLSAALSTFLISLTLAYCGWEYWALVVGLLSGSLIQVTILWGLTGWRPKFGRKTEGVKDMVKYGLNLTGFDFVNYFARNLDNILIGRFLGAAVLGYYTRAYSLLLFPITNIRGPIVSVALPVLSQLQSDKKRFCAYYRRMVSILAMLTMPVSAFCFVESEDIVLVMLGEKWQPVAYIARWLALASVLQPVAGVFGAVLMAQGLANRHFRCGVVGAIVYILTFSLGIQWGLDGMLVGFVAVNYMLFVPIFLYASRGTGIKLSDFGASTWGAFIASLLAGIVMWKLETQIIFEWAVASLLVKAAIFGVIYLVIYGVLPGGYKKLKDLFLMVVQAVWRKKSKAV